MDGLIRGNSPGEAPKLFCYINSPVDFGLILGAQRVNLNTGGIAKIKGKKTPFLVLKIAQITKGNKKNCKTSIPNCLLQDPPFHTGEYVMPTWECCGRQPIHWIPGASKEHSFLLEVFPRSFSIFLFVLLFSARFEFGEKKCAFLMLLILVKLCGSIYIMTYI